MTEVYVEIEKLKGRNTKLHQKLEINFKKQLLKQEKLPKHLNICLENFTASLPGRTT